MVSEMKACYSTEQDYAPCVTQMDAARTGLPVGSAAGQVSVTGTGDTFTVVAKSLGANGTQEFTVSQPATNGQLTYTCKAIGTGACPTGGNWSK